MILSGASKNGADTIARVSTICPSTFVNVLMSRSARNHCKESKSQFGSRNPVHSVRAIYFLLLRHRRTSTKGTLMNHSRKPPTKGHDAWAYATHYCSGPTHLGPQEQCTVRRSEESRPFGRLWLRELDTTDPHKGPGRVMQGLFGGTLAGHRGHVPRSGVQSVSCLEIRDSSLLARTSTRLVPAKSYRIAILRYD